MGVPGVRPAAYTQVAHAEEEAEAEEEEEEEEEVLAVIDIVNKIPL